MAQGPLLNMSGELDAMPNVCADAGPSGPTCSWPQPEGDCVNCGAMGTRRHPAPPCVDWIEPEPDRSAGWPMHPVSTPQAFPLTVKGPATVGLWEVEQDAARHA